MSRPPHRKSTHHKIHRYDVLYDEQDGTWAWYCAHCPAWQGYYDQEGHATSAAMTHWLEEEHELDGDDELLVGKYQ